MKRGRLKQRDFGLKIKSVGESGSGSFSGLGAVYNNVDLGGDQIMPGAFSRTIQGKKQFPLLWQHNSDDPIGTAKVTDTPQGLQVDGQLLMELDQAKSAYLLIKAGIIQGLSIGFETLQETVENGVRQLKELKLWEFSIVTFPMNESAQISSVKSLSDDDRTKHLKAIDADRRGIDRHQRSIRMHLKAMFDGLDDDDSDDDPADDPALLEGNEGDEDDPADEGMSMLLAELKSLASQADELASA